MIVRLQEGEEQGARVESRPLDRAGSLRIASVRARSRPILSESWCPPPWTRRGKMTSQANFAQSEDALLEVSKSLLSTPGLRPLPPTL